MLIRRMILSLSHFRRDESRQDREKMVSRNGINGDYGIHGILISSSASSANFRR